MTMQADQLMGAQVTGSDGQPVGIVDEVFRDDVAGTPSWVRVRSGGHQHLVPLGGSIITTRGLSVPFDARKIADEPVLDVDMHLSAAQEEQLRGYFGIGMRSEPVRPAWTSASWTGRATADETPLGGEQPADAWSGAAWVDDAQLSDALPGDALPGDMLPGAAWVGEAPPSDTRASDVLPDVGQSDEAARLGEARWNERQPGAARPGEARPGDARPGEARPGEARPGDARPGDARRGAAQSDEVQRGAAQSGEVQRGEVQRGEVRWRVTRPVEAPSVDALSNGTQPNGTQPSEARWSEARWSEVRSAEARLAEAQPGEARLGKARWGELQSSEARWSEVQPGKTRWSEAQVGEARRGEAQPGRAGEAVPKHAIITGRPEASSPADQGWLVLSEERFEVETEVVESGRVRLHRYVDTEPVERVVHVFHEVYEIEHIPIVPGEPVSDVPNDGEQELILHEKRAVFVKRTVPVERVRLAARRIEEDRTFRGEIRRERIEVETEARPESDRPGI